MVNLVFILITLTPNLINSQVLISDESTCQQGFEFQGFCYSECPSGFSSVQNICKPSDQPYYTTEYLTTKLRKNFLSYSENLAVIEKINHLNYSQQRGIFFEEISKIQVTGPAISSLSFTGDFFVLVLRNGEFLSGFEKRFFLEFFQEKIRLGGKGLEQVLDGFEIGKWSKGLVQVRMINLGKASFVLKFGKEQFGIEVDWEVEAWKWKEIRVGDQIGKGDGFVGFLYRARLYNQIFEEEVRLELENCYLDLSQKSLTKDLNTLESQCSSHTMRRLAICLDPPTCSVTSTACPTFFTLDSQNNCILQTTSSKLILLFYFDTSYSEIYDLPPSTYKFSLVSASTTAQGAFKRGKYFNGFSDYYKISPQISLAMNSTFIFWIKLDINVISALINKPTGFRMLIGQNSLAFYFTKWLIFKEWTNLVGNWNYLKLVLTYYNTSYTSIEFLVDTVTVLKYGFAGYQVDSFSDLFLGYLAGNTTVKNSYFKGWIYMLGYYESSQEPTLGSFTQINSSTCKYLTLSDQYCISDCNITEFYDLSSFVCNSCSLSNLYCKTLTECSSCHDPSCLHCNRTAIGRCNNCTGYAADGYCFNSCPLMYTISDKKCIKASGSLEISFKDSNGIFISPGLINFDTISNFPIYTEARGYLFPKNSILKSRTAFYYGPEFTISIWLKIVQGTTASFHFENSSTTYTGFDFVENKFNVRLKSGIVSIDPDWNPGEWNVYWFKYYSLKSDYAIKNPNLFYYDVLWEPEFVYEVYIGNVLIIKENFVEYGVQQNRSLVDLYMKTSSVSTMLVYTFKYTPSLVSYTLTANSNSLASCGSNGLICMNCPINTYILKNTCADCIPICESCPNRSRCTTYIPNSCRLMKNQCYTMCPTLYYEVGTSCVRQSLSQLTFIFNSLTGVIRDTSASSITLETESKNSYPNLNYLTDPIPSLNRGFYFGRTSNTSLKSSVPIMFGPDFFFGIWINPVAYSQLFKKGDILHCNITSNSVGFSIYNLSYDIYYFKLPTNTITLNSWNFIGINNDFNSVTSINTLKIFFNKMFNIMTGPSSVLHDSKDYLYIGSGNSSYYTGWIYKVIYSTLSYTSSTVDQFVGSCQNCVCPSGTNTCLPTCKYNEYYSFGNCLSCGEHDVCNSAVSSSLCFNSNCTICTNFTDCAQCSVSSCPNTCYEGCGTCSGVTIHDCLTCSSGYFFYSNVCIPKCPYLTNVVGSTCVNGNNLNLVYNFYLNSTSVTDSLGKMIFTGTSSVFGYFRGWATTNVQSTQNLVLSPYPSFFIWVKLSNYGQILVKKNQSLREDIKLEIDNGGSFTVSYSGRDRVITSIFTTTGNLLNWRYFIVSFEKWGVNTTITLYIDGQSISKNIVKYDYLFTDETCTFELGNGSPMFIYQFIYSISTDTSYISSSYLKSSTCIYPAALNDCLWECGLNEYSDSSYQCKSCSAVQQYCKGPLYSDFFTCYTYLYGACTDQCPLVHSNNISSVCILDTDNIIDFSFNKLNTPITSSNALLTLSSGGSTYPNIALSDPKPGFKRGFFFFDTSLTTNIAITLSNIFTIETWINANDLRNIFGKTRFNLTLSTLGIQVRVSLMDSISFICTSATQIYLYDWNYVAATFSANRRVDIVIYVNRAFSVFSRDNGYFIDTNEIITIGGQGFKGWMYRLKYTSLIVDQNKLIFYSESRPDLWNCILGSFNQSQKCVDCTGKCNCRRASDCTLCQDPRCEICSDYSTLCTKCFDNSEFLIEYQECRICSKRCAECKYYMNSCSNCKVGMLKNYDLTCMLYCGSLDLVSTNQCVKKDLNIIFFTFQKLQLPYSMNNLTLNFGFTSSFYPDYDKFDPLIIYQRGLYFSKSYLDLVSTQPGGFLQLSNRQTFELYFLSNQSSGYILSYIKDRDRSISLSVQQSQLFLEYSITDTFTSSILSLSIPYQLGKWMRLSWTFNYINQNIELKAITSSGFSSTNTTFNVVFDQLIGAILSLGSQRKLDFFNGYIYHISIDNYVRTLASEPNSCSCSLCTYFGECLIECGFNEYLNNTCNSCLASCNYGCSSNQTCSLHQDSLCSSYNWVNETCDTCFNNSKPAVRPCECIEGASPNPQKQICECPADKLIYQSRCDYCYRYLKQNEVNGFFLSNFVQVTIAFAIKVFEVSCLDLFYPETLAKFGTGYDCSFNRDQKGLTINLGKGFSLMNEGINLNTSALKGAVKECGFNLTFFAINISYTVNPPTPVAIIKSADPVYITCRDLYIDGSLSTGQILTGLLYKWEFESSINELSNYPKDFVADSFVSLAQTKLRVERLTVKLTVKNRFELVNSTSISISLISTESIMIEFDKTVDYTCYFSKICQFFVKDLVTCLPSPVFVYQWSLVDDALILNTSELQYFWSLQAAPDGILIPAKFMPYGDLKFLVTVVDNVSKKSGFAYLNITVKPDPLDIVLSKASGSITEESDLVIEPTIPSNVDPRATLEYDWVCLINNQNCLFNYNRSTPILTIPKNIVKLRLFDQFVLNITSILVISRRLEPKIIRSYLTLDFKCEIVRGSVPSVNLVESKSQTQPKFISFSKPATFQAIFNNNDESLYSLLWDIDTDDKSVFLSETNLFIIGLDINRLTQGKSYKLTFTVTNEIKQVFTFYYEFTVNSPPKFGLCNVNPSSGVEQTTEFFISCTDWVDFEENYPLMYSFGVYNGDNAIKLVSLSRTSYYSTVLAYTGKSILVFVKVYDSLEDFVEVLNEVQLKISESLDFSTFLEKANNTLQTSLTNDIPSSLISISTTFLNRDLYTQGEFTEPSNETLSDLNKCLEMMSTSLTSYITTSIITTQLVDVATSILQEMTKNPALISDSNFNSTTSIILNLLTQTSEIGITPVQAAGILTSLNNSIVMSNETLYNKTSTVQTFEDLFSQLGQGMVKTSIPSKPSAVSSGLLSLTITTFDKSSKQDQITINAGNSSSVLPSELVSSFTDLTSISIFTGHIDSVPSISTSTPTATYLSVFSLETGSMIPVHLSYSTINISIPVYDIEDIQKPGCFYLNSSQLWDKTGCKVVEINEKSIVCACNHLSLFAAGDGVEGGGFMPSTNIEQTVDISALSNINAKSAIGFYFVAVVLAAYALVGTVAWNKDSKDIESLVKAADEKNAKGISGDLIVQDLDCVELSHQSLVNEAQIVEIEDENQRINRIARKQSEEIKQNSKHGLKVILEEHRLLSVLFHNDPSTFRFTRCSLLFLLFVGKMYFIGLFYESENKNNKIKGVEDAFLSYTLRDFLVMIYSIAIVLGLDLFLQFVTRIKPIDLERPREIILRDIRHNKIRRFVALIFCWGIMGYYCWSIAMFALNLEYTVSLRWILNTGLGICSDLTISPLFKLFFKGFILAKIVLHLRLKKIRSAVAPMETGKIDVEKEGTL